MQNVKSLNLLNRRPTLLISHEGLEAIKHIVSIAPQEAQWFHTVEPLQYEDTPDEIFLELSTKLYIPKQNTSAAQVDSTSSMMIEFYNELKQDYQDQTVVNEKLSSMTCWCHSHHNMNPSPSHQDDLQFNSFITLAQDQGSQAWQVMLIFNKKDQFYSRVWDPLTGLIYEGVDILVQNQYDFTYIDKAAKQKFIKQTFVFKNTKSKSSSVAKHWFDYKRPSYNNANRLETSLDAALDYQPSELFANEELALEIFQDLFEAKSKDELFVLPVTHFTSNMKDVLYNAFFSRLDNKEIAHFIYLSTNNEDHILKTFTNYGYSKYGFKSSQLNAAFNTVFDKQVSLEDLYEKLVTVLDIADCTTKKEAQSLLYTDPIRQVSYT